MNRYTGFLDVTHTSGTAGATTSELLAENPDRNYLRIDNHDGAEDAYIKFGVDAVVSEGIKVPSGGHVEFVEFVPSGAVNCIRGASTNLTLHVTEG